MRRHLLRREAHEWRSIVAVWGPLPENYGVISFGDEYFLSLGAHAKHRLLLMEHSASIALTFPRVLELVSLMSFLLDDAVVPDFDPAFDGGGHGNTSRPPPDGHDPRYAESPVAKLLETLRTANELVQDVYDPVGYRGGVPYEIELEDGWSGNWSYLDLPVEKKTWRLLAVYWHGLLSTTPWTRILNFWRVFEAAVPGKPNRIEFFERISQKPTGRVAAFWRDGSGDSFNKVGALRSRALRHRRVLKKRYGTLEQALRHLYETRRSMVAHAVKDASEFDHLGELQDLIEDAQLVRFIARAALESAWS